MNALDRLYIGAQLRLAAAGNRVKEFWKSQKGVSNVVATIVILLIVVLLIGIFWGRLKVWIEGIMNKIFGSEFTDDGLTKSP